MMSELTREDLLKEIEYNKKSIEHDEATWDQTVPYMVPVVYFGLGRHSRCISIYYLLLGNREEAKAWFGRASDYFLKSREPGKDGEVQMLMWAVLASILSGDGDLMAKMARVFDDLVYRKPPYFYYFVACLSHLILREDEPSLKDAGKLRELEPRSYIKVQYYNGLGECCEGVARGDTGLVVSGLADILNRHEALIPSFGKKSDDALVCIPASALIMLARMKGMVITAEDVEEAYRQYIPWNLFE